MKKSLIIAAVAIVATAPALANSRPTADVCHKERKLLIDGKCRKVPKGIAGRATASFPTNTCYKQAVVAAGGNLRGFASVQAYVNCGGR